MDTTKQITKKQKHLLGKYDLKYKKSYLMSYLHAFYPDATWETLDKEQAQKIITGKKAHERKLKEEQRKDG